MFCLLLYLPCIMIMRIESRIPKFGLILATLIVLLLKSPQAHSIAPNTDIKNIERTVSFLLREVDTPFQLQTNRIDFAHSQIREGIHWINQLSLNEYPFKEEVFPSGLNHQKVLASLIWGLFHFAVQKEQGFDQGTLVIEDPEQILFKFLLSSEQAYLRPSTHFQFSDCKINQYGIDFYGNWEDYRHSWNATHPTGIMSFFRARTPLPVLPANKSHILFGQLPAGTCTHFSNHHVFIKLEDSGLGDFRSYLRHARDYLASRNFISRPIHGNYFQIERFDQSWLERFESLLRSNDQLREAHIKAHLKKARQWGLRYILKQAFQMYESSSVVATRELAWDFIEYLTRKNFDHLDSRTGKEVIFLWSDLLMMQ